MEQSFRDKPERKLEQYFRDGGNKCNKLLFSLQPNFLEKNSFWSFDYAANSLGRPRLADVNA